MKPIVKYQGGKSRELPIIKKFLPNNFERVIEPFAGGAAVSFALGKPSVLNDINWNVINLYNTVADIRLYTQLQDAVNHLKTLSHNELELRYYDARDLINSDTSDALSRALAYIIVRQLCFSGMERYNTSGKFNVPFGHYQKFSCSLTRDHHLYLNNSIILHGDFALSIDMAGPGDFIFVDPPYLDRLGYSTGDGGADLHNNLYTSLKNTTSNWMIVHSDSEFYRDTYKDYNILDIDFQYAQRFGKNKDHSGTKVKHLYITNYERSISEFFA